MAIEHAISGQPIDVAPLGARLASARSVALFKSEDLEVLRLVLPAGGAIPAHKVSGEITIQCVEGRLTVTAHGRVTALGAGQLLFLAGGVEHSVAALEPASAIVTIALVRHAAP